MRLPPRPSAAPPPPAPPTGVHPAWPSDPSVGPIPLSLHASAGSGLSNHFGRSPVFKNSSFDAQLALLRTQMVRSSYAPTYLTRTFVKLAIGFSKHLFGFILFGGGGG